MTYLKPDHRFAKDFLWMFPGWAPTKFVKIGVLALFSMELLVNVCNFLSSLKNIFL